MTISIGIDLWGSVCYCQMKLWKNDPCKKVNPLFGWGGMLLWTNSGTVGCAASGGFGIGDWSRCWKQVQENIWRWHQPFYCILEEGCCSSVLLFSHPINFRKLWNCAPQVILFQKHPAKHTWRSIFFSVELGLCTLVKDYDRMLLMQCPGTWFISTLWILQEKDRRYKELGIRDKITLTSGRFFLGNK